MADFVAFPKIARLFRDVVVTEKIDGTNAAIGIEEADYESSGAYRHVDGTFYRVYAQSRKRLITPADDNFSFAKWVWDNAETLITDLGPGIHFGEWWGNGIQRGYGKSEKTFSLFNVKRWDNALFKTANLDSVPVLWRGEFSTGKVVQIVNDLRKFGSMAAPGYMRPEGIVVYHTAANTMFKVTLENDEQPKSLSENAVAMPAMSGI